MPTPNIDYNLPIAKNLEIIYGGDYNINSPKEAELAEAFLKLARPKISGDELRINGLRQALNNYYAVGESAFLSFCAKSAYRYIADKGSKVYEKIQNYINKNSNNNILAQNK